MNNLKKSDTWKIQLTWQISSTDNDEESVMHSKSDNTKIIINDKAHEVIEKLFELLKNNLESMKGSVFIFNSVHLLYYKCHQKNWTCGGSCIDSPYWIKKKATMNPLNRKNNKCYQYAVTVALNNEEIGKTPDRITKIKPFINKYKWEGIEFPLEKDNWKKIDKKNRIIALSVLYAKKKKEIRCPAYVSKHNSNSKKQEQ